jgi:hypothetical protein
MTTYALTSPRSSSRGFYFAAARALALGQLNDGVVERYADAPAHADHHRLSCDPQEGTARNHQC